MSIRFSGFVGAGVLLLSILLSAGIIAAAQATAPATEQPNLRYTVQSGDVLDLNFPFVPEFNQVVTVQPDGYITLRGVGEVTAAGLTVPELKQAVEKKYVGTLNEPVVAIEMKDFNKPFFLAQGELGKPGKYDLRGDVKLSEAVAIAGGLSETAKHSQVLLFRKNQDKVEVKEIDLKQLLNGKHLDQDVPLQSGDMVFVPKSRLSKIRPWTPLPYFRWGF